MRTWLRNVEYVENDDGSHSFVCEFRNGATIATGFDSEVIQGMQGMDEVEIAEKLKIKLRSVVQIVLNALGVKLGGA